MAESGEPSTFTSDLDLARDVFSSSISADLDLDSRTVVDSLTLDDGLKSGTITQTEEVLKRGEVIFNGQKHILTLHQQGLCLETAAHNSVADMPWCDVVRASSAKEDDGIVSLHHVMKQTESNKLGCKSLELHASGDSYLEWIQLIEKRRNTEGKPRKLLVLINPIGGSHDGEDIFYREVKPLLDLAGIGTTVKVTQYFRHAVEIAYTFDLTSIDGVVVCGGDGFYAEILHGMMLQTQEKAGVDPNDPTADLTPPPVPIALIPTGTGNRVSMWVNSDEIDVTTATLNIVRGKTTKVNMTAVFDCGRLVHYCGLRLTYGYNAQLMKRTDELRWMRTWRYYYVLLASLFWPKYTFDLDLEILQVPHQEKETEAKDLEEGKALREKTDGNHTCRPPVWVKLGRRRVTNLMYWGAELQLSEADHLVYDPFSPYTDLILDSSTGGLYHVMLLVKRAMRKSDLFDSPTSERHQRVIGFRFRYTGNRGPGPSSQGSDVTRGRGPLGSGPISEEEKLSRSLDVDGEVVDSEVSSVECRFHSRFVPVFGVQYVPT